MSLHQHHLQVIQRDDLFYLLLVYLLLVQLLHFGIFI